VYVLADGRALVVFSDNGRGRIYESRDALATLMKEFREYAAQGPINPLIEMVPQGEAFPGLVPSLIHDLANVLRFPLEKLDGTEASLIAVDKALRRVPLERVLSPEVIAPLTAYVGEVIRLA